MSRFHIRALMLTSMVVAYCLGAVQVGATQSDDRRYLPIFKAAPDYPADAEAQRIEGYVVVEYDVSAAGKPVNVRAVEQSPRDGTFEAAALAAAERFRYLPERRAGSDVVKRGIRNRLTFDLARAPAESQLNADSVDELARSSTAARKQLEQQLHKDIEQAERTSNTDQFVRLAKVALELNPGIAEYLIVRAGQIGKPSDPNELRIVGGMILHQRGAHERAIELFESVNGGTPEQQANAGRWIKYLKEESLRANAVHSTLVGFVQ